MSDAPPTNPILATPGPSNVPERVRMAMSPAIIHHRSGQWSAIFADVLDRSRAVFGTERDVAVLTSSGTGAMEAAVTNLMRAGDTMLVASFGRFGQRWAEIGEAYGVTVHHLELEWGERPDPAAIADFVAEHPDAVALYTTHSETSTGTVSDLEAIAASVQGVAPEMLLCVDTISSAGAVEIKFDEWGIDVAVSGSQKAWMLPPGLAYVVMSERAEAHMRSLDGPKPYYFSLEKALDKQRSASTTPFTPALTLVIGMQVALDMIYEEGLANRFARHECQGRATRAAMAAMNVELFSPDDSSSAVLTAIEMPDGIPADAIRNWMRDNAGITLAGGQVHLKGRIVRIGHCGWFTDGDLANTISHLERAFMAAGHNLEPGAGSAAAAAILSGEGVTA